MELNDLILIFSNDENNITKEKIEEFLKNLSLEKELKTATSQEIANSISMNLLKSNGIIIAARIDKTI